MRQGSQFWAKGSRLKSDKLPKVWIPRRMRSSSGSCDTPSGLARKSRVNSMSTPLERLFERGFSVHRSGFVVAGTLRFYMFSTLNLERRTQEPRTSTYRPTNSKMSTSRPDESRKSGTAVRGFIKYLKKPARHPAGGYGERKVANREP